MQSILTIAALGACLCGAVAQTATPQPSAPVAAQPEGHKIAPGSVIPVQLTKTVDAKKAKSGDEVVAKVTMDMKTQTGEVMVPKDTRIYGHVTEAQARSKEQKESQLAIVFDRAVTKDGNTMQLPMSIQAIVGQQSNENAAGGDAAGPSSPSPGQTGGATARSPMGSPTTPTAVPTPSPSAGGPATETQGANSARPPITAQTQGVIGLSNVTLSPNSNASQGSVVVSDKNNVKLESGTMLLLRVNR